MSGCMDACMGGWVGSGRITKTLINLDLIDIIQIWLNIYDLWRHPPMCGWLGGCVGQCVGSEQITKYQIKLDLIEIIQF